MKTVQRIPAPTKLKKSLVNTRQICCLVAFVLPVYKLLETPSLLSQNAFGDLIVPAFLLFLGQFIGVFALVWITEKTGKGVYTLIKEKLGVGVAKTFYLLLAVYFLFSSALPLLDLEKYTHAVFYDTAPSRFTFAPFFLFSGYVCLKNLRALGRMAELCAPVFIVAFVTLIAISVGESDLQAVLPWFEFPFPKIAVAVKNTTVHFSDALLLLPLLENSDYKQGDWKKISGSYWLGAIFSMIFFAVFYGIYTTLAPSEHYAFSKIAQYFPALKTVGRVDLLLTYLLTVILSLVATLPALFCCFCVKSVFGKKVGTVVAVAVNLALFLFTLYCNKYYTAFYSFFQDKLWWIFPVFNLVIPLLCLGLTVGKSRKKGVFYAK